MRGVDCEIGNCLQLASVVVNSRALRKSCRYDDSLKEGNFLTTCVKSSSTEVPSYVEHYPCYDVAASPFNVFLVDSIV
jgi:hypothetical protein